MHVCVYTPSAGPGNWVSSSAPVKRVLHDLGCHRCNSLDVSLAVRRGSRFHSGHTVFNQGTISNT